MPSLTRRALIRTASLSCVASLAACQETLARIDENAGIELSVAACPEAMLSVGDSLQFVAKMISQRRGDMAGNPDTLYRSHDNPGSFRWSVKDPKPEETGQNAAITERGVLTARVPGTAYVYASSAGKRSDPFVVQIVPRVTRFSISPQDTSVRVGDTIVFRADVAFEGTDSVPSAFDWSLWRHGWRGRAIQPVDDDPDSRVFPRYETKVFAAQPGAERFSPCLGGVRRVAVSVTVTGEELVVNRDVPPALRLVPAETTVFVGETFTSVVRVLNAGLGNGPYQVTAVAGDGTIAAERRSAGAPNRGSSSKSYYALIDHRYFTAGRYNVEVTVVDSAGRSSTVRTAYTAVLPVLPIVVNPDDSTKVIRLSDKEPHLQIAVLSGNQGPFTSATSIYSPAMAEEFGLPPVRFGRTVITQDVARRTEFRDVNGDNVPDNVMYLDRAALIRNGDLRLGDNELRMTAGTNTTERRIPGQLLPVKFATPVSGIARFKVLP